MRRSAISFAALALALGIAACGSDNKDSSGTDAGTTATAVQESTPAPAPATTPAPAAAATKPKVVVPTGPAPKTLVKKDLKVGTGAAAKAGDTVSVQYVGVLYKGGQQFDASWDRGQPFQFQLGGGMVIPGWDQGVPGMKVGGRRQLVIPPDLAYGPSGQGPIGPNATLVFVIDLVSIDS